MPLQVLNTAKRASKLTPEDWRYLAVAAKELLLARIRHAREPTGRILQDLRQTTRVIAGPPKSDVDIARLSWAIDAAAARVPWRSDCLLRVMAADRWLGRLNLPREFFLGVGKDAGGQFAAHAWLRSNDVTVTGGSGDGFVALIEPETR